MSKIKALNINILFIVIASIIGTTFSILFPLYQTPDELTHINMIYDERNLNINFHDVNDEYTGSNNLIKNENKKVEKENYFDLNKKIHVSQKFKIPKITIVRHFPQWIGMLIGEIFHLPTFFYITLCELIAMFFYIFICNRALKIVPVKKHLMMFIMLLPICCQQMSSFSYDVVLNSFCFLFIAYVFYLKNECVPIKIKEIIILLFILIIIGICKIPYLILGFLCLILLNKQKINLLSKKKKIILVITILLFFILLIVIGCKILLKYNIGRLLISSIDHPIDTIKLFYRTIKSFIFGYFESIVGNLGWYDVKVSRIFVLLTYILMFILTIFNFESEEQTESVKELKLAKNDKFIIGLFSIILICLIILSMFNWTLYLEKIPNYNNLSLEEYSYYLKNMKVIVGVQGRYFIPVIPLLLITLKTWNIKNTEICSNIILLCYYIIFYIYYVYILLNRYWF